MEKNFDLGSLLTRRLYRELSSDEERIITAYAADERRGIVARTRNAFGLSTERYAAALYRDGVKKGWIAEAPRDE